MSETKPIEHFTATLDENGRIVIHVEIDTAGAYVGDFTLSDALIEDVIARRSALSNEKEKG
jgi:hypothetical protein